MYVILYIYIHTYTCIGGERAEHAAREDRPHREGALRADRGAADRPEGACYL